MCISNIRMSPIRIPHIHMPHTYIYTPYYVPVHDRTTGIDMENNHMLHSPQQRPSTSMASCQTTPQTCLLPFHVSMLVPCSVTWVQDLAAWGVAHSSPGSCASVVSEGGEYWGCVGFEAEYTCVRGVHITRDHTHTHTFTPVEYTMKMLPTVVTHDWQCTCSYTPV